MNAPEIAATPTAQVMTAEVPTEIGARFAGGFFAGVYRHNWSEYRALIVAPKALGEYAGIYHDDHNIIEGAVSYFNGNSNTSAMAEAGSAIAKQANEALINGCSDWAIPARDQLELLYYHFKPTARENGCYFRDGENPSALQARYAYLPTLPTRTSAPLFQEGAEEAFEEAWYWSSTQYAGVGDSAWAQNFNDGNQFNIHKRIECRVRLVRSVLII